MEDLLFDSETSEWGHLNCVILTKLEEFHDFFADYILNPSREVVQIGAMSNKQVDLLGSLDITALPKVPKLPQNLFLKNCYVLQYFTLKLYHELGRKKNAPRKNSSDPPRSLDGIICRPQHPSTKNHCKKYKPNLYKHIVNSGFSKTREPKLGRKKQKIVRIEKKLCQITSLSMTKRFQILDNQSAMISFSLTSKLWDNFMIVGGDILDLAKRFMFQFLMKN